ncbi:MAG: hypothetical protein COA54_09595 [Thiotrichaceae bacterium]|nr:MAG: hypothetical protein COA54_09595 [Thiotrichaceae bacterium]
MRQFMKNIFGFAVNKIFPAFFLGAGVAASVAQAAPQGGVIVGGTGSINTSVNTTNINQSSGALVIDWSSFNVNQSETVNFNQPSSRSVALNRINDQSPSQIFGSINSNGRVFLSNPNGIIFGQSATVNVGALMATSLSISKDDFMKGNYLFNAENYTPGAIINRGTLTAASGGSISLVGSHVVNSGFIIADYGQINLATGKQAVLNFDGDGLISFKVSEDILTNLDNAESSIENIGSLQANGGQILLDAHVAKDVFTNAINNEGVITARRLENKGGEVYLFGNSGNTIHSGAIDVYGEAGQGGSVLLLGENVGLFGQASIDASGDAGGGTVLIGGDYQGENANIQNAEYTYISEDATIKVDAVEQGDGGKVIVWADNTTRFYGDISAKGGASSGNGGFTEISGKQGLVKKGMVDLTAANGATGTLLLDPGVITITIPGNSDGSDTPDSSSTGLDTGTSAAGTVAFTDSGTADPFIVYKSEIEGQSATANIILQATDAVNVSGSGTVTLANDSDLTIQTRNNNTGDAATGIDLTGVNFVTGGSGSITLQAGTAGDNTGATITTDRLTTGAGSVTITAEGAVTVGDNITTSGGSVIVSSGGAVDIIGNIATSGGDFTSSGTSFDNGGATITTVGGSVDLSGQTGVVTIADNVNTSGGDDAGSFTSAGTSFDNTGGTITTGSSSTGVNLNAHTGAITIASSVNTNGNAFTATNVASAAINAAINAGAVNITSSGAITQTAGSITASSLIVSAVGGIDLDGSNAVAAFSASNITGGAVVFNNASGSTLDLQGVSNSVGDISIDETGNISISGGVNAGVNTVTLDALGSITDTALGIITAGVLDTDSVGGTALNSAHVVGAYTARNITTGNVVFNNASGGTLDLQAVSNTVGNITVDETGNISVSGGVNAGVNTVTLDALGSIADSTGVITAGTLDTDSVGGTVLNNAHAVGAFTANNITSGVVTLNNASGGTLDLQAVSNTSRNITLDETGNISVSGAIDGATIVLDAVGAITDTGTGVITATTLLNTDSTGGTVLNQGPHVVAAFTANNTSSGNVELNNASGGTLDLQAVSNTVGDISINETGNISVNGAINAAANTVTLDALGSIADTVSGIITAGILDTDSVGGSVLDNAHAVTAYTARNITSGNIVLDNASAGTLDIQGIINTVGDITINETGNITLSSVVTASISGTAIIDSASGSINGAGTVTGSTVDLRAATGIGNSTAVTTVADILLFDNSVSGAVEISNAKASGVAVSGTNNGVATITETAGNLEVAAAGITTTSNALNLFADNMTFTGTLDSGLAATTLSSSSATTVIAIGDTASNSGSTLGITDAMLGMVTASSINIGNAANTGGINFSGAVSQAGNTVNLNTGGVIAGTGTVTAGTLDLVAAGGIGASGMLLSTIADIITFDNSTSGGVYISNTQGTGVSVSGTNSGDEAVVIQETSGSLTVDGGNIVSGGNDVSLIADNTFLTGTVNAGIGQVTLTSNTATQGIELIGAGVAAAGATLQIDNAMLNQITAAGITLGDASQTAGIDVNGVADSSTPLTLQTGGAITQTSGSITVSSLTLDAQTGIGTSGIHLDTQASTITFSNNSSTGDIFIDNSFAGNVTVSGNTGNAAATPGGVINITELLGNIIIDVVGITTNDGGDITLTANAGNITGTGLVSAGTVNLISSTGIGVSGAAINTAADNVALTTVSSGGAFISNTKASGVSVSAASTIAGEIEITETAGDLTISGTIMTASGNSDISYITDNGSIVLTATTDADGDTVNIDSAGSISGAGAITASTVNLNATSGIGNAGVGNTVFTIADTIVFENTASGGSYLSNNKSTDISSGSVNTGEVEFTGTLGTTTVSAAGITTNGGGGVTLNATDAVLLTGSVTASGNTITVSSINAGISGAGELVANTVNLDASGTTNVSTRASNVTFDNDSVNGVTISNDFIGGVIVSGTSSGLVDITEVSGNLTIGSGNIVSASTVDYTTTSSNIILTGSTTTGAGSSASINSAGSITGTGRVTTGAGGSIELISDTGIGSATNAVNTATATLTFANGTSGGVYISNALSTGVDVSGTNFGDIEITETAGTLNIAAAGLTANDNDIDLIANRMTFDGLATIDAGAGLVTLTTSTASRSIQVGNGASNASSLGLTDSMLNQITTSVGVLIGGTSHTGGVRVVGDATPLSGGTFELVSQGNVAVNALLTTIGDTTIQSTNGNITFGANSGVTSTSAGILLDSNGTITGSGALTLNAATDLVFNKQLVIDGTTDITAGTLNVQSDIMTTTGNLTITSASAVTFNPSITITAADLLTINAESSGAGDLNLNGGSGITLNQNVTVNGLATLNAGTGTLTVEAALATSGGNNISISATDIDLNGTIDSGTGITTIRDAGNSIGLGLNQTGRLNIDITEFQAIGGAGLTLATSNDIRIEGSFVSTSTVPLTLNAATITMPLATTISLQSSLNIMDSAVTAASSLDITVAGAFDMNNTIETNGAFTLIANQGVDMGEAASIISNNSRIDITTNGDDILLGLVDAGSNDVNLTAKAGSVLNNNGVFDDVTRSKTNIIADEVTITANSRIGASSTDAITINANAGGLITLDFKAEKAFINNLQNTKIINNGTGDVAVGLIFSGQIIGVGHNVGLNAENTEGVLFEEVNSNAESDSLMSVLGADYKLSAVDEEEEDSSTLNTVVPVMIRTNDGWEFKAPLSNPTNEKGGERKVNWL